MELLKGKEVWPMGGGGVGGGLLLNTYFNEPFTSFQSCRKKSIGSVLPLHILVNFYICLVIISNKILLLT